MSRLSVSKPPQKSLESMIKRVIIIGIFLSLTFMLMGGFVYLQRQGSIPVHYHIFLGEPHELTNLPTVEQEIYLGNAAALIQLGVMCLVLTPLIQLFLCALYFLQEGEWISGACAVVVFAIVFFSLIGILY